MENLIPFLLFVLFGILSAIGKAKKNKKKKQRGKAPGREGLATKIHALLTDLQKRLETRSKKAPNGTFEWEQLIDRSRQKSTETTPHDGALENIDRDTVKEPPKPLPKATPNATSHPPHMPIRPSEETDMAAVEIPRMSIKKSWKPIPAALPTSRADLRRAVVWSEILGPPIALRDPFGDNK